MNTYENAVPKPLKFLVSDGKLVDDEGNVIAESESLQDLYTKWNPEVKKYLLSDGSVVDENNNLIIKNNYYKKMYDQADPKVAKYLHSDGTVDENPGGSGADLENNHQTTIDVSTYTEPVEVVPESGKDGMKKCTVTLSNIPSGSGDKLYAWYDSDTNVRGFAITESVAIGDKLLSQDAPLYSSLELDDYWFTVTAVGEGTITIASYSSDEHVLTRDTEHDISF